MKTRVLGVLLAAAALALAGCAGPKTEEPAAELKAPDGMAEYTTFRLTTDLSVLSDNDRKMIPLLIDAAQGHGRRPSGSRPTATSRNCSPASTIPALERYVEINYGPWDRLDDNEPFVDGVGPKPPRANLYPQDMTKEEFEAACAESPERAAALKSLYTVVRRDEAGELVAIPYNEFFAEQLGPAAEKLRAAAELAEDPGLKNYLELRADALLSDDYHDSDMAWMDMKDNAIDVVIGPIETYEDRLFGYKAAFEAYVLVKDLEWSAAPGQVRGDAARAAGRPAGPGGVQGGDARAPTPTSTPTTRSTTRATATPARRRSPSTCPTTRRSSWRRARGGCSSRTPCGPSSTKILLPIADLLIAEDQRQHVTFDAFFANTMFHEVAHGLGIKNTIDGRGTVREALQEHASAISRRARRTSSASTW